MSRSRRVIAVCAWMLPLLLAFLFHVPSEMLSVAGGEHVAVEYADTPQLRQAGLSERVTLGTNEGMMFVFDEEITPAFWMKDMNFALDIVWIRSDKTVAGIEANVTPETFPETFSPDEPIQYVLEVKAGRAEAHGIEPGVSLSF